MKKTVFQLDGLPKYEALKALSQRIPEIDPGAVETYLVMLKASTDMFAALDSHFARHGTSRGRFVVLITLFHNPNSNLTPAELAKKIKVTRPTMTGLLDGLEHEKLIQRERHLKDRRMVGIRLTNKGREFLEKMLPDHYRRVAALMAQLSSSERKALISLLSKVSSGIPALRDP